MTKKRGGNESSAFGTDEIHQAMDDLRDRVNPAPAASQDQNASNYRPPDVAAAAPTATKLGANRNSAFGGQPVFVATPPAQSGQGSPTKPQQQPGQAQVHKGASAAFVPGRQGFGAPPQVYPASAPQSQASAGSADPALHGAAAEPAPAAAPRLVQNQAFAGQAVYAAPPPARSGPGPAPAPDQQAQQQPGSSVSHVPGRQGFGAPPQVYTSTAQETQSSAESAPVDTTGYAPGNDEYRV